ncbi:urea ABC transporter permease subunit UrtB [Halalkalibacterium halodurans]|jgi:urea transport system permease protein|uniref:ABC transporter (Permease) n=1 Tax=Halalkalibacterium halodurans (strain ATCC BAA-125 / DSM 18197 / FERM 7344 / JCM 9153 / C-125) TaxID=272558 RepID=Q9KG63_HALH5|nr:urea ABC transporter permease subunit UrtB [Halalkalibacterium halodurans]MDY7220763.1 urea ABC transporter permease subunit UrtB [Halalkalibacterium halodurans]MDY7240002.1 urea ABC transporter permease subunit UrtB [Halalkalibacterium halodurans]MED4082445.1 urea ABC transporter permease subunit UrtB [Halalkalibacterium halodurans]MED4084839.1 urea ABC transporter permease subunit UrtB [Halalkalibacterium halodurans]MED4103788.1 urea ABC transporter permease subunit UrtB [Halalkalibacteri
MIVQLFNGISLGSILLLIALGLAITFGMMRVINMAHGELIMVGAYATYVVQLLFSQYVPPAYFDLYFLLAVPLSFVISALIGILIELTVIRHLYGRPLDSLLATFGVGLILQQTARTIFGAPNVGVQSPSFLRGGLEIAGVTLPFSRLFIITLVLVSFCLLAWFFYKTRNGRKIRGVMQNRSMATCLGISTRKVDVMTFAIGSGCAGLAGAALTLLGPIGPTIGTYYIVDAFMVVVVGGVGMLVGTVAGALGIGMFNTLFEYWTNASLGKVLVFACIILFLQWRPQGLFSLPTRSLD